MTVVVSSQFPLTTLRKAEEFTLYRGEHASQPGSPSVLLLVPTSIAPSAETVRKLEYEYSLRDELDAAWAIRPLTLTEHLGQPALVLEDPGGEPLDRFLSGALELESFLRIAI